MILEVQTAMADLGGESEDVQGLASDQGPFVRREDVVNQVLEILRAKILSRDFQPGSRLVETRLADYFRVSRTPIREAIRRLESEGLVSRRTSGGVTVTDMRAELRHVYGLRARVEGYAAFLAAETASENELTRLRELCQKADALVVGPDSTGERLKLSNDFHRTLRMAASSPLVERVSAAVPQLSLNPRMSGFFVYDAETVVDLNSEHWAIVEALTQRNGERAEELVRTHFLATVSRIEGSRA